ncbi:hypothetical protein K08M3_18890 [Vibrio alginolyticus]|uniref:DUF3081 domain-containing protein n=1 Tax=Vibrio alginolyticus TaxID=663 RepID=A0A1W6ULN0_VIBAL|nr:hypothetical protein K01M1_18850 [Vibrio alginolyticus]ARP03542.1 hypothetical protein K04M1_18980 [Vibrio alginolyticus]ARP08602.1 hypothetical protein K04M3_19010 [Vibrio alginolyticus]ARP13677.1 hypothetical protein K04M5_18890 [Vibrio alginolyticus]ARP18737.1 hypothetical protein K05K4_19030 [Vibrio alginolyticus]
MKKILHMIYSYVGEDGFKVIGNRFHGNQCYYDLKVSRSHITVYINGNEIPFYRIENFRDGVNFCQVVSAIEQMRKICRPQL